MACVRFLCADDHDTWKNLWAGYCAFYQADVPRTVTDRTWAAVLDSTQPVLGRGVFSLQDELVGFSISVIHPSTWQVSQSCYLEDLFVDPRFRGAGFGRLLLDDLVTLARELNWGRIYWHTKADNFVARRLYDTYVTADEFVRYRLLIDHQADLEAE